MRLFHVCDIAGIDSFVPRAAADGTAKVWAIEERTLANYLLPRDCPRVCARRREDSSAADLALLEGADVLIAIEAAWLDRVRTAELHLYEMPTADFTLEDQIAGYWTSARAIVPIGARTVADLALIAKTGARLVALPSLWDLRDRIAASTLDFSMIRMRNATPR